MTSTEIFYHSEFDQPLFDDDGDELPSGWYWWSCFPGCLPDSDPFGPFASRELAQTDADDDGEIAEFISGAQWTLLTPAEMDALKRHDDGARDY